MSEVGTMSSSGLMGGGRRPEGTRRRQLEWITNFALVVVSLFGISVGAGLIVFYKMDHFGFISPAFRYIPWLLLGGGLYTLVVSGFGLVAVAQRSQVLLVIYSCFLFVSFVALCGCVVCAIYIVILVENDIEHHHQFRDHINKYTGNPLDYSTREIDLLQWTYRCCGDAEDDGRLGYTAWIDHPHMNNTGVPRSCCINPDKCTNNNLFIHYNSQKVAAHAREIFVHGCIKAINSVLKTQIQPLMLVFSIVGALLALLELLGIVLACALAHVIRRLARQKAAEEARMRQANVQLALKSTGSAAAEDTSL